MATIADFTAALDAAEDPSCWACQQCGSTDDCWMCLEDGTVMCTGDGHARSYAMAHCKTPLFIQIAQPQTVKNMATNANIKLGSRKSDDAATVSAVTTIKSRLRGMQHLGGPKWASAKGWDKLRLAVKLFGVPFLTRAAQIERRKRDVQATALKRWAALELWTSFRRWKSMSKPQTPKIPAGQKRTRAEVDLSALPRPAAPKTRLEQEARLGHTGLRNLGNTCYMNSTIQALTHIPLFRAYMFSLKAPTHRSILDMLSMLVVGGDVLDETGADAMPPCQPKLARLNSGLADLLEFGPTLSDFTASIGKPTSEIVTDTGRRTRAKIEASAAGQAAKLQNKVLTKALHEVTSRLFGFEPIAVYSPDAFLKTMWINLPQFSGFVQQDAEEFLRAFIQRLDVEASSSTADDEKNVFKQMFAGSTTKSITCSRCNTVSRREEEFFGPYSLDIPLQLRSVSSRTSTICPLDECLKEAFAAEELKGDSAYDCAVCKQKTSAVVASRLKQIPPIFVVHVNRISWGDGGSKIFSAVTVPKGQLDLKPWIEESSRPEAAMYDFHAVVRHVGSGFRQGHYTAYARNDTSQPWFCFNDARVGQIGEEEFEGMQGYLYFFQRRHM